MQFSGSPSDLDCFIFDRVAIIGVGLIGGSMGLAMLQRGIAKEITGYDTDLENLAKAKEIGAITNCSGSIAEAVSKAQFVLLCVPPGALQSALKESICFLQEGAVVTDVCSIKRQIVAYADNTMPEGVSFIGGHPMAGREVSGISGAVPNLFDNCTYLVTPTTYTNPLAISFIRQLIKRLGAKIIEISPEDHDFAVAVVSHLPHIAACSLVNTVACNSKSENMIEFAAGGFKDMTRVASSEPLLWVEILLRNKDNILYILQKHMDELGSIASALSGNDVPGLVRFLKYAKSTRDSI